MKLTSVTFYVRSDVFTDQVHILIQLQLLLVMMWQPKKLSIILRPTFAICHCTKMSDIQKRKSGEKKIEYADYLLSFKIIQVSKVFCFILIIIHLNFLSIQSIFYCGSLIFAPPNVDPTVYKTGHLNIISMTVAICAVLDVNQYEVHDP